LQSSFISLAIALESEIETGKDSAASVQVLSVSTGLHVILHVNLLGFNLIHWPQRTVSVSLVLSLWLGIPV